VFHPNRGEKYDKNASNKGLLSMPPNSHSANPTHGGTAASVTLNKIQKKQSGVVENQSIFK